MKENKSILWIGILLIFLGALFLIENLNFFYLDVSDLIFSWQGILVIIGAIILVNHRNSNAGLVILTVGLVTLAAKIFNFRLMPIIGDYWPVILIVIGLYFIFRRTGNQPAAPSKPFGENKSDESGSTHSGNKIDEVIILSSAKKYITSSSFQGGKITTIFGGADIDLLNADLAEGQNTLDIVTVFGGIDLFVPRNWKVVVNVTSIFGGFDDGRRISPAPDQNQDKVLVINGLALFGGGEIKN